MDRDRAQQLKLDNKKLLEKNMDRRNLYLANEGLVVDDAKAGEGAAGGMTEDDRKKRLKVPRPSPIFALVTHTPPAAAPCTRLYLT